MLKKESTWFSKFDWFVCVYVCEHLSELVKERQWERAKKDQLDFRKRKRDIWLLCVCVCVWAFVWGCKRETERESKKRSTRFSKEREKKKKKVSTRFSTKEKKKLISLHWKNLFPHFVKTYFPVSTCILQMALHWSILNFFKVSFIKHTY